MTIKDIAIIAAFLATAVIPSTLVFLVVIEWIVYGAVSDGHLQIMSAGSIAAALWLAWGWRQVYLDLNANVTQSPHPQQPVNSSKIPD